MSSLNYIDINCDVGEGVGNEADLMPLISSCNIACGGHAGDEQSMKKMIELALANEVHIGAHPSYPDRENFGRATVTLPAEELKHSVRLQVNRFKEIVKAAGAQLHHIKAHGALYNDMAKDASLALLYLEAIEHVRDQVVLYVPFQSAIAEKALDLGFTTWFEAFADRNYDQNLSLVSRRHQEALITEPKLVLKHLVRMVKEQQVKTLEGSLLKIYAQTYCVHGDTPDALKIITYLVENLPHHKVRIKR